MSLSSRQQRILAVIEDDLRASDPQLVAAFGALASNTRRMGRRVLRWRWRSRGHPAGHTPVLAFIPLVLLAAVSVVILAVPAHGGRACRVAAAVAWPMHPVARHCAASAGGGGVSKRESYPASPGSYLPARIRRLIHP